MKPYYADDLVTLWHGDALDVLSQLPDSSVNCCVTSPPYFGLRDYGVAGQIGAESSPAEFVAALVAVFGQVRRVLADDGTLWLNIGDSYSGYHGNKRVADDAAPSNKPGYWENMRASLPGGLPPKNLLGVPWRTAFALQDDGWILRNAGIWHKPNAMPESVTDRLSTRYEHLFLFSKSARYWFDLDAVRVPTTTDHPSTAAATWRDGALGHAGATSILHNGWRPGDSPLGRNPGDVWTIPTTPFPGAHFAAFPPELPRRCIAAGCKPGGTVLDPFHGSGTTGMVAQKLGRPYVGIDLNADYLDLSLRTRLADAALPFDDGATA